MKARRGVESLEYDALLDVADRARAKSRLAPADVSLIRDVIPAAVCQTRRSTNAALGIG